MIGGVCGGIGEGGEEVVGEDVVGDDRTRSDAVGMSTVPLTWRL